MNTRGTPTRQATATKVAATTATPAPGFIRLQAAINKFLVSNGLRIVDNPCISPDFCLDWAALAAKLTANGATATSVRVDQTQGSMLATSARRRGRRAPTRRVSALFITTPKEQRGCRVADHRFLSYKQIL